VPIPCNVETPECYSWTGGQATAALNARGIWPWPGYPTDGSSVRRYFRLSCQIYNEIGDYEHLLENFINVTGTPTVAHAMF